MIISSTITLEFLLYKLLISSSPILFPTIKWNKDLFTKLFPTANYSDEYKVLHNMFYEEIEPILDRATPNYKGSVSDDDIVINSIHYSALLRFLQLYLKRQKPNGRRCTKLNCITQFEDPILLIEFLLINFEDCLTYNFNSNNNEEIQFLTDNICNEKPSILTDLFENKENSVKKFLKHIANKSKDDSHYQQIVIPCLFRIIQLFFQKGINI
jgi:hypothetical protein